MGTDSASNDKLYCRTAATNGDAGISYIEAVQGATNGKKTGRPLGSHPQNAQPKVIWEPPPGALRTREEGLSVMKFPTFWPSGRW